MSLIAKRPELPATASGELQINYFATQFARNLGSGRCMSQAATDAAVEAEVG
jgi:hypothetical protein